MNAFARARLQLRGSPAELWLLLLCVPCYALALFTLQSVVVLLLTDEYGLSDVDAGACAGSAELLAAVALLGQGVAVDRVGLRAVLASSCAAFALGLLVLATAARRGTALAAIFTLRPQLPWGAPGLFQWLSLGLRRAAPPASHPTVFGIMYVASNAAYMSSGFLIDGVLAAARRPGSGVTSGSRALMLICAAAASAAASLAGALREEQVRAVARDADAGAAGEGAAAPEQPLTAARLRAAAADPAARRALGVAAVATTAVRLAKTVWDHQALTFPKYAIRSRGCGAPFGALDSINGAAVVLLVPAATHLLAHLPPGRLVRAGTPGFALSPLLLAVPSYVAFALYFLASSAFEAVWSPQADSWLLSLLPPGREGIFTGLAQIPSSLVGLLSGALSGGLLARFCPLAAEASCAAAAPGAAAAARGRDAPCRGAPVWAAVAAVACAGPAALWLLRGWLVAPQPPAPRGAGEGAAGVPPAAEEGGEDEASGLLAGGGGGGGGSSTVG